MPNQNDFIKDFDMLWGLDSSNPQFSSDYFNAVKTANSTLRIFYMYFFNLVTNIFKWDNLPESCDEIYIEDMLCLRGKNCFAYDKNLGIVSPQFTMQRKDMYGRPTSIDCLANEYSATFDNPDDFVIIRNTNNYIPTWLYIDYFCNKIVQIQEITEININAQKTPVVFKGTREQRMLLQEEFKKYDGNAWYLFLEKNALGNVESLNTNAPFIADKLTQLIQYYTDQFLTFIGLNNSNGHYKKERSLVDEIQANNEMIGLTVESMLSARQKACDEFNEKFKNYIDKPISVRYSDEVQKMQDISEEMFKISEQKPAEKDGEEDE